MSQDAFPTADAADAAEQARPVAEDADADDAATGAPPGAGPLGDVDAAEADVLEQRAEAPEDDEDGYRA